MLITELISYLRFGALYEISRLRLFIPDIYIAPLQKAYSEALSVQLRPKGNFLRSLQKEDTLQAQRKWEFIPSGGPITEKARRCLSAERARGTKSSPRAEERRARRNLNPKPVYRDQSSKMGHNHPSIAIQVLQSHIYKMPWETGSQCRASRM